MHQDNSVCGGTSYSMPWPQLIIRRNTMYSMMVFSISHLTPPLVANWFQSPSCGRFQLIACIVYRCIFFCHFWEQRNVHARSLPKPGMIPPKWQYNRNSRDLMEQLCLILPVVHHRLISELCIQITISRGADVMDLGSSMALNWYTWWNPASHVIHLTHEVTTQRAKFTFHLVESNHG